LSKNRVYANRPFGKVAGNFSRLEMKDQFRQDTHGVLPATEVLVQQVIEG
jgi:hypothetical protein